MHKHNARKLTHTHIHTHVNGYVMARMFTPGVMVGSYIVYRQRLRAFCGTDRDELKRDFHSRPVVTDNNALSLVLPPIPASLCDEFFCIRWHLAMLRLALAKWSAVKYGQCLYPTEYWCEKVTNMSILMLQPARHNIIIFDNKIQHRICMLRSASYAPTSSLVEVLGWLNVFNYSRVRIVWRALQSEADIRFAETVNQGHNLWNAY